MRNVKKKEGVCENKSKNERTFERERKWEKERVLEYPVYQKMKMKTNKWLNRKNANELP